MTSLTARQRGAQLLLLAFLLGMAPSRARAASPAAEALFQEGRRLLQAGRTDEACVKLQESLAQEVSSGTLLNLALCHETQGKVATAWAEYRAAGRLARQQGRTDRADAADARALALESDLPHVTLTLASPIPGIKVLIDADTIGEGALDVAVPIDPGHHEVTASAPGRLPWTTALVIERGELRALEIPALELEPVVVTPPPVAPPPVPPPAASPSAAAPAVRARSQAGGAPSKTSTVGWIVGGAGVVGVSVGVAFGLRSLASYRDADRACPAPHLQCNSGAISDRRTAESTAWVSNIALGVGLLAVGAGAYLILSSRAHPDKEKIALSAQPIAHGGWLGVSSGF